MQADCVEFNATPTATVEFRSSNSSQMRSWTSHNHRVDSSHRAKDCRFPFVCLMRGAR